MTQFTAFTSDDIAKITALFGITVELESSNVVIASGYLDRIIVDSIDEQGLAARILGSNWMKGKAAPTWHNEGKLVWFDGDLWRTLHIPSVAGASIEAARVGEEESVTVRSLPQRGIYFFFLSTDGAGTLSVCQPPVAFDIPKFSWPTEEMLNSYLQAAAPSRSAVEEAPKPAEALELTKLQQFKDFFDGMAQPYTERRQPAYPDAKAPVVIRLTPSAEGETRATGAPVYCMEFLFDADGKFLGSAIGE